jgi:hypothetical protein
MKKISSFYLLIFVYNIYHTPLPHLPRKSGKEIQLESCKKSVYEYLPPILQNYVYEYS